MMREMTLLNDEKVFLENEQLKLKEIIKESQQEIMNYQNQLDLYAKVLKSMEEKAKFKSSRNNSNNVSMMSNNLSFTQNM